MMSTGSGDKGLAMMHYEALHRFLKPVLDAINLPVNSSQRASAREKLLRLTKTQFSELSTDVFDELLRREKEQGEPFLAVNPLYHQKRNQARQKLATLPTNRFRDLASDVYFEIKRRFPEMNAEVDPDQEALRAENAHEFLASSTSPLTPQDSMRSLDQSIASGAGPVEGGPRFSRTSNTPEVTPTVSLALSPSGSSSGDKRGGSGPQQQTGPPIEFIEEKLRSQYEGTIKSLKSRISQLETTVKDLTDANEQIPELEQRLTQAEQDRYTLEQEFHSLQAAHDKLNSDFRALQEDYSVQEQIANDIRVEATNLLEEIKNLSTKNDELKVQKERDQDTIQNLQGEVSRLKAELSMSQSLRRLGTSHSTHSQASNSTAATPVPTTVRHHASVKRREPNIDFGKDGIRPGGVISIERFQAYQKAVQELLNAVRSETPSTVLVAMKNIVLSCKSITEDVEAFEHDGGARMSDQEQQAVRDATNRLSGALTQQMGLAKELATRFDSSSVPALENATCELTSAVLDLSRSLKSSSGSKNVQESVEQRGSGKDDTLERMRSFEIEELKVYLEKQTDLIVQAIQTLLQSMRQPSTTYGAEFKETVDGITRIVESLVRVSRRTLSSLPNSASSIQQQGEAILQDLSSANLKLDELGSSMMLNPQSKTLKQKLASSSYEIAKFVKELISLIE